MVPSRYLIFLTPRMDRLIAKLRALSDPALVTQLLEEHDTLIVGPVPPDRGGPAQG